MKHTPFVTCSIHPRFKRVVASRLVKGALSVAYRQRNVTFAGPTPTKYAAFKHNHTLLLHLDSTQVDVRDKNGFEVRKILVERSFCIVQYNATCWYSLTRGWTTLLSLNSLTRGWTTSVIFEFLDWRLDNLCYL